MNKIIFSILLLTVLIGHAQTTTYYSENFQSGKPTNMTYYDEDGLTVNSKLNGTGLENGTWHILLMGSGETDYFMGSTSWFSTPGQANDWMITPKIKIYGTGATLTWRSIVCDASAKRDGYKVYVSTTGKAIADFESEPIFSIEEESSARWITHSVNLDKYAGEQIYIAFVNDSYDKYIIAIDDITVTGPEPNVAFNFTTPVMTDSLKTHVSVQITNTVAQPVNTCRLSYTLGEGTISQDFTSLNLVQGASTELVMDRAIDVALNETRYYSTWIEIDGDKYTAVEDSIKGVYFVSNRRTVLEEGTGTWCGNCPSGIAAMDYLAKWYPDNFIGIAIHGGYPTDPMYLASYDNFCSFSSYGYPTGLTDRKFLSAPATNSSDGHFTLLGSGFEGFYQKSQEQIAIGEITGEARYTNSEFNSVEVSVTSRFINDLTNETFKIAIIVLEDSVTSEDGTLYTQHNYYSSEVNKGTYIYALHDTLPNIGGFAGALEYYPMKFNHVARGAVGDSYSGLDPQFPANIQGGQEYRNALTFSYGEGLVNNPLYTYLVAMLIDNNGYIVNACKIHINSTDNVYKPETDNDALHIHTTNNNVIVSTSEIDDITLELYNANGEKIMQQKASASQEHTFTLPVEMKGVYIIKASTGKASATRKLIF